jgi:hypothetical protein
LFYIKTEHQGKQVKIDIYDDEIFTKCINCGKEIQVDTEMLRDVLADGGDLTSTSIGCCRNKKPELSLVK